MARHPWSHYRWGPLTLKTTTLSVMAGASTQQLLLVSAADLQKDAPGGCAAAPMPESLEDGVLQADGAARPRQRRAITMAAAPSDDGTGSEGQSSSLEAHPLDDQPRWHHHSLVDPQALTPMLRHYVALKSAHPDRL